MSVYLLTTNLKGVSSLKLSRDLEVTQKTAWFLAHRIRKAFEEQSDNALLSPIEVDETYVGGLSKNKHASKKIKGTQGRSIKTKSSVVGIKSRVDKNIKAKVTETVKKEELQNMIEGTVTEGSSTYQRDREFLVYVQEGICWNISLYEQETLATLR